MADPLNVADAYKYSSPTIIKPTQTINFAPNQAPAQMADEAHPQNDTPISGINNPPTTNVSNNPATPGTPGGNSPLPVDPITGLSPDTYKLNHDLINNPSQPAGAVVNPTLQTENPNEFITNSPQRTADQAKVATATAGTIQGTEAATANQANIGQIQQNEQGALAGATYNADASALSNVEAITGAHGAVDASSTVQGQLAQLMNFSNGTPSWAQGAVNTANAAMAARGLGASSIAGAAITQAIIAAGLPIAQQDAQTYAQMNLTNLSNEQQAVLQNSQNRQQAMLSDQAATNAARQFNAQNTTQVATFFSNLMAAADQFNVNQANSMTQQTRSLQSTENVARGQLETQTNIANAQAANQISTFNAQQSNAMKQFYDSNQLIVDQSNTAWRRDINTANTAATNTANQINAANLLGISNTAMANEWQASRDYAGWVQTASENDKARASNITIAALNNSSASTLLNQQADNAFFSALGGWALDILTKKA